MLRDSTIVLYRAFRSCLAPVMAGGLLSASCSVTVDANRAQCATDEDCVRRGPAFAESACVESLCLPKEMTACEDGSDCMGSRERPTRDACVGSACGATDARVREAGVKPPSRPSVDAGMDADASFSAVEAAAPSDATNVPDDEIVRPPAEDAALPAPRECNVDDDCALLGKPGNVCIDALCFPAVDGHPCTADAECSAYGPEFVGGRCVSSTCRANPRWRCEKPTTATSMEPLAVTVFVRDSLSLNPLRSIRAQVCQKLDVSCSEPITETTSDSEGYFKFTVPADFAGYMKVEDRRYMPAMYFFPPALPSDGKLQPFPLLGAGLVDSLALSLGSRLDRERGHMMLVAEDCLGMALPGVSFTSTQPDRSTIQFYVRDLLPSTTAKETAEVGNGGYLNFPIGNAIIDVTLVKSMLKLTTFSVVVRPGFISVAYVRPDAR